ncbi:DUF397 domain-containing protein [Streptomyces beihaiensis]|uniref:DUF397 domain-containing protein n=1 Tax=Streptomyces beihaiensis TaxID=2984495 RepID=A0ABT3TYR3_9ACTN|nr:DUF397 domain-containing protein [Streptomyces beihaiensis]MCX3062194.1 DUF397 domain-containing protein [Streptomyces beihaiensis]
MTALTWQKSSFCGEGESCVHIAATDSNTFHVTESSDLNRSIVTASRDALTGLLNALKQQQDPRD